MRVTPRGRLDQRGLIAVVAVLALVALAAWAGIARPPGQRLGSAAQGPHPTNDASSGSHASSSSPGVIGRSSPSSSPDTTLGPASDVPVLVGAGDIGTCGSANDRKVGDLIAGIEGTVFADGDLAYNSGTPSQFTDCYGTAWGDLKGRTRPVPGNHDWGTRALAGYLGYWGPGATDGNGGSWYSFDLAGWHVLMLDANCSKIGGCGPDSAEGRWLASNLAASKATCTIAFWHQPRFSSGQHGNDPTVAPLWDAVAAAGGDVVVNGHDHDYERFAPMSPDGSANPSAGMREFVVGTGGAPLRGFKDPKPTSEFRQSTQYGALVLTLKPAGYEWKFVAVGGAVLDSGTGSCH